MSAASSGRLPSPTVAVPSSVAPVCPRTNNSVSPAATMAPCQAMSWPNQSFISNVRSRCTGAPTTASASICTISSGRAGPQRRDRCSPGRHCERVVIAVHRLRCRDPRAGGQPGDVAQRAARGFERSFDVSSAVWVWAAASPGPATVPSGCRALRPLMNTRVPLRIAPATIEADGIARNGSRRSGGIRNPSEGRLR